MTRLTAIFACLAALALPSAAAAAVPENADWTEAYIDTADGQPVLHADILKPKGTPEGAKLPVVLSIGPYHGHGGQSLPNGPSSTDRPSTRWKDLIKDGRLFERGYILVMADLRGFGGSHGCNDFGGKGEQNDVKRAVEWAAAQPWSNGKVSLYGKSYDGWTGVMGLDEKPKGLAAAVIQAPIQDGYRTLYQNGVHYEAGWYGTPGLYQMIDAIPPAPSDNPDYVMAWAQGFNPACYAQNITAQNSTVDRSSPFWQERELPGARGTDTPIFWSHGFMDANTKPDNFLEVWSSAKGPKQAWFGQWDHVRGNESDLVGREGFFEQMFVFLDRYMKDDLSADPSTYPGVTLQEGDGRWRGEAQYPPADAVERRMEVKGGTVTDAPNNAAEGEAPEGADQVPSGVGAWSFGPPLPHEARLSGVPKVTVDVSTVAPRAAIYALLYDVAPDNTATLISRAAHAVTSSDSKLSFELYPNDWTFQPGHRVGLLMAGSDLDWYNPPHSGQQVEIAGGTLSLPFLSYTRSDFLAGEPARAMGGRTPIEIDPSDLESRSVAAEIPPALVPRPAGTPQGGAPAPRGKRSRLRVSIKVRGRRIQVFVRNGLGRNKVSLVVKRGRRVVARRVVGAKRGVAKRTFRLARPGRYTVTATLKGSRLRLSGRSRTFRVR